MSQKLPIEQTSEEFQRLIRALGPNEELVLTDNGKPIAKVVAMAAVDSNQAPKRRVPGAWKGMLEIIDDSDDVILEHFKDYLPDDVGDVK